MRSDSLFAALPHSLLHIVLRLWWGGETRQRVAIERLGLPRRPVPLTVLISNDRDGYNHAAGAQLVGGCNSVVELPVGPNRELDRSCQLVVPEQLELVLAGVLRHLENILLVLALIIPSLHYWEFAVQTRPFSSSDHLVRRVCGMVLHDGPATGFPHLCAVHENDADVFALVEQVRLRVIAAAAQPQRNVDSWIVGLSHVVVDMADGQVPVVINVIDPLAGSSRAGRIRAGLRDLHPASEERRVCALQFVPYLNGEVDWAGVDRPLVFGDAVSAALETVPTPVEFAVELQRRRTGNGVFDVVPIAAVAVARETESEKRNPTPHVAILAMKIQGHGSGLKCHFIDTWLVLADSRSAAGDHQRHQRKKNKR